MEFSYGFDLNEFTTSNGVVHYDSLTAEIFAQPIIEPDFVGAVRGKAQISFREALDSASLAILQQTIADHSGYESVSSENLQFKRKKILDAAYSAARSQKDLKNEASINALDGYLSYIFAVTGQWIVGGNHLPLIARIEADSQAGQPYSDLLTFPVAPGIQFYQYFISKIPTTPYI